MRGIKLENINNHSTFKKLIMKKLFFICFTAISVAAIATTSSVKTNLNSNSLISKPLYDTVPNGNGNGNQNSMDTSRKSKSNKSYHSKSNKHRSDSTGNTGNNGGTSNTDSTQHPF